MSKYNSGVYRIEIGDKYYYGLSSNLTDRKSKHLSDLRFGRHKNPYMQAAYSKHGEYSFRTLVYCEGDYMSRLEASLIQQHYDDDRCMNLVAEAGCGGSKHSEESRRKISESKRGKPRSEETRRKLSKSHRGKVMSDEARMRMSIAQRGRRHTPETIQKMRDAATGRRPDEKTREKLRLAHLGRPNLAGRKAVSLTSPDGESAIFESLSAASLHTGIAASTLSRLLSGRADWSRLRAGSQGAGWIGHYIENKREE